MKSSQNANTDQVWEEFDTPETVLHQHLSNFQDNNLEALMAHYNSESILVTPEASYKGPDEIKEFFIGLMYHFPKGRSSVGLDKVMIHDELIYIIWNGKAPGLEIPFATDTFIIKDGMISRQTFAGQFNFLTQPHLASGVSSR